MLTVSVLINGKEIIRRSALNVSPNGGDVPVAEYNVCDGMTGKRKKKIKHERAKGAAYLAAQLLLQASREKGN